MRTAPEFLLVAQAAERLGVAVQTIRNWIAAGKLRATRHPMNQYRLIPAWDIDNLLKELRMQPTRRKAQPGMQSHG